MKTLSLLLISIASLFCQDLTNEIYWHAQPLAVQELKKLPDNSEERYKSAELLASQGFKIDVPIMVYGWDAYKVMKLRKDFGYTWVPSALMPNIQIAPGLTMFGAVPYDPTSPPSGSIKVSTDAKDYPPVDVVPPVVAPKASPVGPQSIGSLYLTTPGDTSPADTVITEPRGKFIKRVKAGPFGAWSYWEKLPDEKTIAEGFWIDGGGTGVSPLKYIVKTTTLPAYVTCSASIPACGVY